MIARTALLVFILSSCMGCAPNIQKALDATHRRFSYIPDYRQYGVTDYWIASERGDCEDFALLLQQRLARGGVVSSVAVVNTERGPHAVLLAEGKVLDNRGLFPREWEETGYKLLETLPTDKIRTEKKAVSPADFEWGIY